MRGAILIFEDEVILPCSMLTNPLFSVKFVHPPDQLNVIVFVLHTNIVHFFRAEFIFPQSRSCWISNPSRSRSITPFRLNFHLLRMLRYCCWQDDVLLIFSANFLAADPSYFVSNIIKKKQLL